MSGKSLRETGDGLTVKIAMVPRSTYDEIGHMARHLKALLAETVVVLDISGLSVADDVHEALRVIEDIEHVAEQGHHGRRVVTVSKYP